MNLYLQDKVVIVTGGGSGIGAAISLGLADEGAIPVIFGHNPLSDELARQLDQRQAKSLFIQVELRDEEACRAAVARVLKHFGISTAWSTMPGSTTVSGLRPDARPSSTHWKRT